MAQTNCLCHYFLQCFDTVGWVIWPVKPVPDMTYNVFSGTLNLNQSISILCVFLFLAKDRQTDVVVVVVVVVLF